MNLRDYQISLVNKTRIDSLTSNKVLAVLPCGGGKTVMFAFICASHLQKNPNGYVWFLVHRQELIDQTIETFDKHGISRDRVLIAMVQSVSRHLDRYSAPSLIVFDEAHHATAGTWTKIVTAFFHSPIIGLTATPCRLDGSGLGNVFGVMSVGVSAKWLIEHKYLSEYDYYAPKIDFDEAAWKIKGNDYDLDSVGKSMDKPKIYGDILKYIDDKRKTIIYAPNISFSKKIEEMLGSKCRHFDGDTPKKERKQIIEDFRCGKISVLTNVNLIGEGFDVPDCDCCILLRPTMSVALYIQQASRCLRYKIGKRAVIYDLVGNVYKHGLPTEDRQWFLNKPVKVRNKTNDKELIVRTCKNCFRVYEGQNRICPYCGHDNGKTQREIELDKKAELQKIEALERKKERMEVGKCRDFPSLVELGKKRGYKNPAAWANYILKGRNNKY
jgi:superfamily II DNA or RNA helicase